MQGGKSFLMSGFWYSQKSNSNCWQKMVQYASRNFLPFGPTHLVFRRCIRHSMHQSLIATPLNVAFILHVVQLCMNFCFFWSIFIRLHIPLYCCACSWIHHYYMQTRSSFQSQRRPLWSSDAMAITVEIQNQQPPTIKNGILLHSMKFFKFWG